ncbi:hypothetical protein [Paraburkholderia acidisoli]|uniref:PLAT domain-containing protein n=1 Tax=Paraburkholderia acidisoli TaxID=2571748 RepID=A0A7Z2JHY9_9BURK|nr:hypothetical protein [Paraburkholderia acidisoli]QGZ66247.1 hypothetical protein FAZ98_31080 [Paraburkholderia acidisoli]QGZ66337.1 hypothetical protein FAZ98_31585 [Paraburkholderia acidisoli]
MKKLLLAAGVAALTFFAGCANTGSTTTGDVTQAQITQFAATAQAKIAAACTVFQPTLNSVSLVLNTIPALGTVTSDVALACAANSALNTTTVSDLINTALPAAIADVNSSSLSAKNGIVAALMVLQSSLSVALAEYNLSVATGTPTSLSSAVAPHVSVKLVSKVAD